MKLKLGLEVEFFATQGGKIIDIGVLGLPSDDYPLLAEARGDPFDCPFKAVASVRAEIERIVHLLGKQTPVCRPKFVNWIERDDHVKALHEAILRRGCLKKSIAWQNAHGHSTSKKNETHISAGMHISFTQPREYHYSTLEEINTIGGAKGLRRENKSFTYHPVFDYCQLFRRLEQEFGAEIDAAERTRGFYEIKPDGRIEYRSLPATLIQRKDFSERLSKALLLQ